MEKGCRESRREFTQVAVKKSVYSGAEAAGFLGVSSSVVNPLAASEELHK